MIGTSFVCCNSILGAVYTFDIEGLPPAPFLGGKAGSGALILIEAKDYLCWKQLRELDQQQLMLIAMPPVQPPISFD